jgi:hypothetical protein
MVGDAQHLRHRRRRYRRTPNHRRNEWHARNQETQSRRHYEGPHPFLTCVKLTTTSTGRCLQITVTETLDAPSACNIDATTTCRYQDLNVEPFELRIFKCNNSAVLCPTPKTLSITTLRARVRSELSYQLAGFGLSRSNASTRGGFRGRYQTGHPKHQ